MASSWRQACSSSTPAGGTSPHRPWHGGAPVRASSPPSGANLAHSLGHGPIGALVTGLAGFALVQSYLCTVTKWGVSKLGALRDLFNGHPWFPPGLKPPG